MKHIGTIIQAVILVGSLLVAGVVVRAQTASNADSIEELEDSLETLQSRTRALEVGKATGEERVRQVQQDINEIKTGQRETNTLLRDLTRQIERSNRVFE